MYWIAALYCMKPLHALYCRDDISTENQILYCSIPVQETKYSTEVLQKRYFNRKPNTLLQRWYFNWKPNTLLQYSSTGNQILYCSFAVKVFQQETKYSITVKVFQQETTACSLLQRWYIFQLKTKYSIAVFQYRKPNTLLKFCSKGISTGNQILYCTIAVKVFQQDTTACSLLQRWTCRWNDPSAPKAPTAEFQTTTFEFRLKSF